MEQLDRQLKRGSGGRGPGKNDAALHTLAEESFDILTLLPTYIENTKDAIAVLSNDTKSNFDQIQHLLIDEDNSKSLAKVLKTTERNILNASTELKEIVVESGHMAESLFETVNDGYQELTVSFFFALQPRRNYSVFLSQDELKSFAKVEQVMVDTADAVIDTKKKIEFGVKQIIFKIEQLVKASGGNMDENLKSHFDVITKEIMSNQNEALNNLTSKVEKEIGQVWRQMGIMYNQVSNSISILEKVKTQTEGYVNKTGKNLGTMEGQVEGLSDRIVDVDENLNYMLGQLSLVVQEFNQVKTGLGEAISGLEGDVAEITEYRPEEGAADDDGK